MEIDNEGFSTPTYDVSNASAEKNSLLLKQKRNTEEMHTFVNFANLKNYTQKMREKKYTVNNR